MKRKYNTFGGWGARGSLTPRQRAEIQVCEGCSLPECYGKKDAACPLNSEHEQYVRLLNLVTAEVRETLAHGA